ncbi:MAG: hypothetical protein JSV78_13765 [Phycisphaerales bacterium]|nr:MAG: hypothetical protein JSV78_13765 [Phycisphaerales bacterium]
MAVTWGFTETPGPRDCDGLAITGTAALEGQLLVKWRGESPLQQGESFVAVATNRIAGAFADLQVESGTVLHGCFDLVYTDTSVMLRYHDR